MSQWNAGFTHVVATPDGDRVFFCYNSTSGVVQFNALRENERSALSLVNNTVYVSTPFYRIFAVEPDTGKVKWIYDAFPKNPSKFHGKNRGMSYWAAANPVAASRATLTCRCNRDPMPFCAPCIAAIAPGITRRNYA